MCLYSETRTHFINGLALLTYPPHTHTSDESLLLLKIPNVFSAVYFCTLHFTVRIFQALILCVDFSRLQTITEYYANGNRTNDAVIRTLPLFSNFQTTAERLNAHLK